jgi:imidazolonepropionase
MSELIVRRARVVTMGEAAGPRRGAGLRDLGVLESADVLCRDGRIVAIGVGLAADPGATEIDACGRALLPGLVDCHTHLCWAGSRVDEWEQRLAGASYLDLLAAGGGIMSTVRAVRAATVDQLAEALLARLWKALETGTTTIEVKSGYGLDTATELKMLRAINQARQRWPGTVVLTACIGHAKDPQAGDAVARTIEETLPAIHAEFPGATVDAYCEQGAWSLPECERLFTRAMALGHPCRVHADQFHALGMTTWAVASGFASVDHLEASTADELTHLAGSQSAGVMLPCSGFHLDGRYADGRGFVDRGGILAIATNANPGSAPCTSMPMAMALAVRHLHLTAAEAIACSTVNGAFVLGLADRGRIAVGQRADLVLMDLVDERELAHTFGVNPVACVVASGRAVSDFTRRSESQPDTSPHLRA